MLRPLLGSRSSSVLATRLADVSTPGTRKLGTVRGQIATPLTRRAERVLSPTSHSSLINRVIPFGTPGHARAIHVPPTKYGWPLSPVLNGIRSLPATTSAPLSRHGHVRAFHSTPPREAWPTIPLLLGFLKVHSSTIDHMRMTDDISRRITMLSADVQRHPARRHGLPHRLNLPTNRSSEQDEKFEETAED